jgi:Leucine Rich Repeat (LRR) protein
MTIAIIMGNLSADKSKKIPSGLRQKFWALCAKHHSSPVFRCSSRNLESLEFLRGMKFSLIDCSNNNISSLEPLKNIPLNHLDCAENKITSLAPLKSMKLQSLECHDNPITTIAPLKWMPLKTLSLNDCTKLKDISSLTDCPTIERLTIPKQIKKLQFLQKMPNLKYLNYEWDDWKMTKNEFFEKYK